MRKITSSFFEDATCQEGPGTQQALDAPQQPLPPLVVNSKHQPLWCTPSREGAGVTVASPEDLVAEAGLSCTEEELEREVDW